MSDQVARAGQATRLPVSLYERALEVGRRAAGSSGPNPPVGCLIVRDGAVVAEGASEPTGGRHAEVVALDVAGALARGSVAVVTLEPCAHHGRTPPCTRALLAAGVREVHVLLRDPDPVAMGGLDVLAQAGVVTVEVRDVLPGPVEAAAHDLRGFLTRVAHARPHVTLKLAQTPDGRTVPGADRYLTGESARRRVHELRADSDAVLVGGATVRTDDPLLDVRHVPASRQPRPVVLSTGGAVSAGARALRDGAVLVHGPGVAESTRRRLVASGVLPVVAPLDRRSAGLDLPMALAALLEQRILTVLAEPGARLAAALLDAHLVDTVELHVAGGSTAPHVHPALPALAPLLDAHPAVERIETPDGDVVLRSDLRSGPLAPDRALPALEGAA